MSTPALNDTLVIVKPVELTDAMLVETNVPEADYATWAVGATYALGARVIVLSTHEVFESLQAGNLGKDPLLSSNATWWIKVGPTNRWCAWRYRTTRRTANATLIRYRVKPGQAITTVAVLGLAGATSVRVRLIDPVYGTQKDVTRAVNAVPASASWWEWAFGEREETELCEVNGIPAFPNADVLIEISGGADLSVARLMLGQERRVGNGVKLGLSLSGQDFSQKETDQWGELILRDGAYSDRPGFDVLLPNAQLDATYRLLKRLKSTVCLFLITRQYQSLAVVAVLREFEVLVEYNTESVLNVELMGLSQ